jgi:predicted N-acyltransferase
LDVTEAAEIRILDSLDAIPAAAWNALAGCNPFLRHEFLHALQISGCATPETGWSTCFPTLWRAGNLAGAMPLYLKTHSYGEFVFDFAWADAYRRAGLDYYPKLVSAVPFTPVSGPRILASSGADREALLNAALQVARETGVSSFHCLFCPESQARELEGRGLLLRHGVQFHWENRNYGTFDDFLAAMSHAKRKNIRQERRKLREAGIAFRWLEAPWATEEDWGFFFDCYRANYRAHHSTPYLNLEFFLRIAGSMAESVLLLVAEARGAPLASALFLRGGGTLYGRYWGATRYVPGLHFETCYYQAIEHAIQCGLQRFEAGAQGEHKLARGLLPAPTWSAHWLAHPEFSRAVERFLRHEARGMEEYADELRGSAPFKRRAP